MYIPKYCDVQKNEKARCIVATPEILADPMESEPESYRNRPHKEHMKIHPFSTTMVTFGRNLGSEHDDDNDYGLKVASTGRWTQEEHSTFLKGLELHGKGWKKIAALIKTRTVVQIRTHAQKYFLKQHKSRHSGGSSEYVTIDGKTGYRKRRRRHSDKPIALALPLQPFVAHSANSVKMVPEGISFAHLTTNHEHADNGLYNFLSPPLSGLGLGPGSDDNDGGDKGSGMADDGSADSGGAGHTSSEAGSLGGDASESGGDSGKDASTRSTPAVSAGAIASTNTRGSSSSYETPRRNTKRSAAHSVTVDSSQPSEWYKRGRAITCLLKDAEGLEWFKDSGAAVTPQDFQLLPSQQPYGHAYEHGHRLHQHQQQQQQQRYHGRQCEGMHGSPARNLARAVEDVPYRSHDFSPAPIDADALEIVDFSVLQADVHALLGKVEPSLDIGDAEFEGFFASEN